MYRECLEVKLGEISVSHSVVTCMDVKCAKIDHCDMVDNLAIEVLEAVQTTAETCLPYPARSWEGKVRTIPVPGWKETVKPFRDNANFWHQVWVSFGKPLNTEVHKTMKKTRNLYHYQFNKCKKAEEKIKRNKLLNSCLQEGGGLRKFKL